MEGVVGEWLNFEKLGFVCGDDLGGALNFLSASRVTVGVVGVEFLEGELEFVRVWGGVSEKEEEEEEGRGGAVVVMTTDTSLLLFAVGTALDSKQTKNVFF